MLSEKEERYLKNIWTDTKHPAAYSGPYKLNQVVKREGKYTISLYRIRQFLTDTDAYSLQKRVQRKFKRRHIVTYLGWRFARFKIYFKVQRRYNLALQENFFPISFYGPTKTEHGI